MAEQGGLIGYGPLIVHLYRDIRAQTSPARRRAGHGYLCSDSFEDIVATLKDWGVVRTGISVQLLLPLREF